jgi:hypothetical protein
VRFGKALLSAPGLPETREGRVPGGRLRVAARHALLLETEGSVVTGTGQVAPGTERLDLRVRIGSRSFAIGFLPTPVLIGGTLKSPSVGPEPAARTGAAAGLAAVPPPLAPLLGVGEHGRCERMQARARGGGRRANPAGGGSGEGGR